MNSNIVLNKIMKLLSLSKEEVSLTYARLKDGTIVESPTFDVGEAVDIVSEDGTKTPAPDGEHELALKDSEGNETLLKIITKDGKIEERENVELEMIDVKPIPQAEQKDKAEHKYKLNEWGLFQDDKKMILADELNNNDLVKKIQNEKELMQYTEKIEKEIFKIANLEYKTVRERY